jgi:hypothetical protein
LDEYGELPLEPVGFHGRLDGVVDPESSEGTDLDKDVEETDETTSDGGRRELGEVDGNDQGQETDGEASEETTKVEDGLMRVEEGISCRLATTVKWTESLGLTTEPLANVCANALAIKMMLEKMTDHFLPYFSVKGN